MRIGAFTTFLTLLASVLGACSQADIVGVDVRASAPDVREGDAEMPQGAVQASGLPGLENFVISIGAPVANDETGAMLGLKPGITAQGPAVSFAASKPIPAETFEKAQFVIPFTGDASEKLVVMYRLAPKGTEPAMTGVIPNTYLDVDNARKTLAFKPRGLGDYQAASSDEAIIKPFTSVSPKAPPTIVPILELLGKINYANFFGIDATGDTVYLIGNTGLRVVSIANPAVPVQIGLLSNANGAFGDGRGIRLAGNLLIQTTNEGGYGAFNVTTPTAPTFRGGIGDSQGRDVTIVGQRGFAATSQGMRVFQYQTAMSLEVQVAQIGCNGVEGDATLVVFACDRSVVGIVPGMLPTLNTVQLDATLGGRGVALADAYAYVAGDDGLRIYDILNPTQPRKVATLAIPGGALQVAVRGGLAIVLTATQAIGVDVRNKLAPALIQGQESTLPISTGRRVKFLSPDRALILDSTGLSVLAVHPIASGLTP